MIIGNKTMRQVIEDYLQHRSMGRKYPEATVMHSAINHDDRSFYNVIFEFEAGLTRKKSESIQIEAIDLLCHINNIDRAN